MAHELSVIVGYVDQLRSVPTDGVPPTAHPLTIHNVFREDEPADSLDPEVALGNAPGRRSGFFCVPRVLDGEGGA